MQIFKALIRLCSGHEHGHLETWQPISRSSYISLKTAAWGASVVDKATQSQKNRQACGLSHGPSCSLCHDEIYATQTKEDLNRLADVENTLKDFISQRYHNIFISLRSNPHDRKEEK